MQSPEDAPQIPLDRLTDLLQSAPKPKSFGQLKSSLRVTDVSLQAALEAALSQSLIFRWPDFRKSQYLWSKSADDSAQDTVLALAATEALSRAALTTRACSKTPGFSRKSMDRIIGNLLASRELLAVPSFSTGKLLIRAGALAPYEIAARKFIEARFRKAGLSPDGLFSPPALVPPSDLPKRILERIRSLEPIPGVPVTTQRLRQALSDLTKKDFDAAALELRKRQEVSLSLHHDPHNLPQTDRDLLIDGRDGNFYVAIAIR